MAPATSRTWTSGRHCRPPPKMKILPFLDSVEGHQIDHQVKSHSARERPKEHRSEFRMATHVEAIRCEFSQCGFLRPYSWPWHRP